MIFDNICNLREDNDKTQKELAERIGTTESNINNYEKGRNKPTTDMLVKICLELDVSADWLLGLPSKSNTENEAM